MCTVTYIPTKEYIYLTSNRDEKSWRTDAFTPGLYKFESGRLLFPKDGDRGGTWIAAHENGNIVIFLNGGFKAHTPLPPYRKSRGLILLNILDRHSPLNGFIEIDLEAIEPFTAIIRDNGELYECRWDGSNKHHLKIDKEIPHIWSSVTLYDDETIRKRKKWFDDWIASNNNPSGRDILHFHQFTGDGDQHNDLMMNRDGLVFTVSVTSMAITDYQVHMRYVDTQQKKISQQELVFEKSMVGR